MNTLITVKVQIFRNGLRNEIKYTYSHAVK